MPYRIITSIRILVQYILLDFIGLQVNETIDCRTKEGKKRYQNLFHRPFPEEKRKTKQRRLKNKQRLLIEFIENREYSIKERRKRTFYDRHYNSIHPKLKKDFAIPFVDQQAIKSNSGYQGSLYQLFLDADLSFFTTWQQLQGITIFTTNCQVEDIVRLELVRIRLGINTLSSFLNILEDWEELQVECGVENKHLPSQTQYLRILKNLGPDTIKQYFLLLQQKCDLFQLYDNNVDIWDARFLFSYNSGRNLEKTGDPTDPSLGVYVHKSKYFGIGYLESRIINSKFKLPKYYD
ncbi:MAG: hypothetical protein HeimC3_30760, partial [Candidatus Heimdallarchaeota archaeon LC_3]